MTAVKTIIVAFSMFSALPVPSVAWNEKNMRYVMCALPLIGVVVGGVCWGWVTLCTVLGLPAVLRGAGLCLAPVLLTGGIHLDGYADTSDALASNGTPEKKQEILADPCAGAFAVIRLCCYFVASFALWTALLRYQGTVLLLSFCLSRTLSGLAVAAFPLAKNTGLAHAFATAADKGRVRAVLVLLTMLLCTALCFCGVGGAAMAVAALCTFAYYHRMARVQFGGISGDLAGWFLQTVELCMLGTLCAVQYLEVLL